MPAPRRSRSDRCWSWLYPSSLRPGRRWSDRSVDAGVGVLGVPGRGFHASGHGPIERATNGVQQQDDRHIGLPPGDQPRRRPKPALWSAVYRWPTSAATPAIVLVHGIASSTETGTSRRPGRSPGARQRRLCRVLYDRLGYAKSSYTASPAAASRSPPRRTARCCTTS